MSLFKRGISTVDSRTEGFGYFYREAYFSALDWWGYKAMLWLIVILVGAFSQMGLLNILAFEFCAIIGLLMSHFAAVLVIREFDRLRSDLAFRSPYTQGPHPRLVSWGIVFGSLAAIGWILLIALVEIQLLNLIFKTRNCDILTGLGFYLTIPVVGAFFASSLGLISSYATSTRKKAFWLYWAIVAGFVIRVFLRLAVGHTQGMNDPFLGMIELPTYQTEASLTSGFLYSRLFIFVLAILLISASILYADDSFHKYQPKFFWRNLFRPDNFLPEIQAFWATFILIAFGLYYMGPLGIEITRHYLEHVLNGEVRTEHFIIRFPKGGEVERNIERVAEEHEYYYYSISQEIEPVVKGPIRSYIYPDRLTKTTLTGVGASVYAKPWTGEIHVQYDANRIDSLKHELTHVLLAPMGVKFFGSSLLGAYGEGIAEGVQWQTDNDLEYHQWVAALRVAIDPETGKPFFRAKPVRSSC